MPKDPDFDPVQTAKLLLRLGKTGALATLASAGGGPYCSLVNIASAADGAPLLLISTLALHTRNLIADSRVSLLLHDPGPGDPLQGARISLTGHCAPIAPGRARDAAARRYLARHPEAEMFAGFADFGFFRIEPQQAHLVAGFGRIVDLAPSQFLTDIADAREMLAAEADAVAHMNADHAEAVALYATRLLGAPPGDWRITGIDPDGCDLVLGDAEVRRLPFPERVTGAAQLRQVLARLAAKARA